MQRIFVGDVQGCADEFEEVVARARREYGGDFELWLVGDLVNRGPDNLRVLEIVRELADAGRARIVLGNHEITLIKIWLGLMRIRPKDTLSDVLESPQAEQWVEWLRRQPLVQTGRQGGCPFAMVHAAVHPDWSLPELERRARRVEHRLGSQQPREVAEFLSAHATDPDHDALGRLTRCRSVCDDSSWSSAHPRDLAGAWHRHWSARGHSYGVVYGHWAVQRLHVAAGLRGLDTGCVHHGRGADGFLTAWLPESSSSNRESVPAAAFPAADDRFWHIPARRRYYE